MERIAPICRWYGDCGGCAEQTLAPAAYADWKRRLIAVPLAERGIAAEIAPVVDAHGAGRRRVVLHARRVGEAFVTGFSARGSHRLVEIDACPLLVPALAEAPAVARALVQPLKAAGKPVDIALTATETGLDVDIRGTGPLDRKSLAALAPIAERHGLARIAIHGKLALQRSAPVLAIGRARLVPPSGGFLQATVAGEVALADLARKFVDKARHVADLFAGIGTFALRLAETARVTAVEGDAAAVAALAAAARTPGLKPVAAEKRDLFARPLRPAELDGFDAVVFDPPRAGAEAQSRALAQSRVPTVVAVSCYPPTFARDAAILIEGGYRLEEIVPVDQFRYAAHVELVAKFFRR